MGEQFIDNLVTNVFIPFLVAYHHHTGNHEASNGYLQWLDLMPPDTNSILLEFSRAGMKAQDRAVSQALLELHKNYCSQLDCLNCAIGKQILQEACESTESSLSPARRAS